MSNSSTVARVFGRMKSCGVAAGVAIFALLCLPQAVHADAITPQQLTADLSIVNNDIASNMMAFLNSPIAESEYAKGIMAAGLGIAYLAMSDQTDAQIQFQNALDDYNGVLLTLGLAPLTGGDPVSGSDPPPVPEPSSFLQLGMGTAALGFVVGRKRLRESLRRMERVRAG